MGGGGSHAEHNQATFNHFFYDDKCDYMETGLFAIVCDLRSAIRDRLRSFAIIWKPALNYDTCLKT